MIIPIEYYSAMYYTLISIVIVLSTIPLFAYKNNELIAPSLLNFKSGLILSITILFIGFRDPFASSMYLGDTSVYTQMYENINSKFHKQPSDLGFYYLMKISFSFLSIRWFYFICAMLYVLPVYITFKKFFKNEAFYAIAVYVASMSFWSFGINGLRNGLACSVFIFSLKFIDKKLVLFLLLLCSLLLHKSMILPILAFLGSFYIKDTKLLIKIWVLLIAVSFLFGQSINSLINQINQSFDFGDLATDHLYTNQQDDPGASKGFRLDFVIYSAVPIVLGYYYVYKKRYSDHIYLRVLNTYIITNGVWLLLMYAAYTNRIAFLSWFLMPLIIVYPILKVVMVRKQYVKIAFIVLGSLAFTIFMFLITK